MSLAAPLSSTFTTEEISMIQELFLTGATTAGNSLEPLKVDALLSEKDVHISDLALVDAKHADELLLDDATSVLLSPIGADDSFLHQFLLVDEKDAMAAFYTEAIDPFESPSPVKVESVASSSAPLARPSDKTLDKLRAKVDALTKMYYTRCHRLQAGASAASAATGDVDVERVQRLHALEKLQRIAAHLAKANAQLLKDTTSERQQRAAFARSLERELSDEAHVAQILATATEQACADAQTRATALARAFAVAGEASEVFGWFHKRDVSAAHALSFVFEKTFATLDTGDVLRKSTELLCTSEALSAVVGAHAQVRAVKKLGTSAAVVLYDVTQAAAARVDRVLALVFREELGDGRCLLAACSLNPPALAPTASGSESVRWMESYVWQLHERRSESAHVVTVGGRRAYASAEEARAMALEHASALLRWETTVVGPAFRF